MHMSINDIDIFFDISGTNLRVTDNGLREVPTLVLIHGGPGADHTVFKPAFEELSDVAQVLFLDLRGHGRSGKSDESKWNLAQWSDDVAKLIHSLSIKDPIICGVSFGGFVAQATAVRHSNILSKLILVSTSFRFDFQRMLEAFEKLGGKKASSAAERYWRCTNRENLKTYQKCCSPLYSKNANAMEKLFENVIRNDVLLSHFAKQAGELWTFNFGESLSKVTCPALVLTGADDPVIPPEASMDLVGALVNSSVEFKCYENASHCLAIDVPEAISAIRSFIVSN